MSALGQNAVRFVARVALVASGVTPAWSAGAQTLASRIEAAGTRQVNFHFTGREGICGDGMRFMRIGSSYQGSFSDGDRAATCVTGPVQVRLTLDKGNVTSVETWVGSLRTREGRELGEAPARESATYLMGIAERAGNPAAAKAILPAVLADSSVVWPALLAVARNSALSRNVRRESSFWLSRFAAGAVAGRNNDPLGHDDGDDDDIALKKQAVFVLSQLPHDEGVADLIKVARSGADQRVRSQALFWLGQMEDPRSVATFESILRGS